MHGAKILLEYYIPTYSSDNEIDRFEILRLYKTLNIFYEMVNFEPEMNMMIPNFNYERRPSLT